jgi:hypothetical protein
VTRIDSAETFPVMVCDGSAELGGHRELARIRGKDRSKELQIP